MPPTTKEAVNYPPPAEKAPAGAELPKTLETTDYTVRSGDTLAGIAKQYGISQSEIIDLNKLSNPNKLRAGQKLVLPGHLTIKPAPAKFTKPSAWPAKPTSKAKTAEPPKSTTAPEWGAPAEPSPLAVAEPEFRTAAPSANEYVVQRGDTLSVIAKKHGTKISALQDINKLSSDKLKVGQKLIIAQAATETASIPSGAAPAAPGIETPPAPLSAETTLLTPPVAPPAVSASTEPAAPLKAMASSGITHTVKPTEDIDSIAKLYVVLVDEIAELNQLGTNRTLQVGQRLKIP
ncbi:MAG: LysM peptidoglycan-binding domain-containing protein [Lentisphaerae bacterium]|nr:LysM peptidoglycan-binding domain-containing protein [Lentisphaerota bacterium]